MQKASMGARIGAFFLDALFLGIIDWILFFFFPFGFYLLFVAFGNFFYYALFEGSSLRATPGKKICGIVVLNECGQPLTWGQGFLRSLCRVVSGLTIGVGYIIALFDSEGKALHDKLAKTFVAKTAVSPQGPVIAQVQPQGGSSMNGIPQIIGVAGQFAGKAFTMPSQGVMLGRDSASCDFTFPDGTQGISRNHCKIVFNPQTRMFVLYDLGSSYGTFLASGTRVMQGQPIALRSGDEFYLASRANLFRVSL